MAITLPGLVGCVTKILQDENQHYLVYNNQEADLKTKTYCGIWSGLDEFRAVELTAAKISERASSAIIGSEFFVAAPFNDGIALQRYKAFDLSDTYHLGTHRNQNVKICRTANDAIACVSYRQKTASQSLGTALDIALLTGEKWWTGELIIETTSFDTPASEYIMLGPDGLLWIFYVKDGGLTVWLIRVKEEASELKFVDYTAILTQLDGLMSPNMEFPVLTLRLNGDHVVIGCTGAQGVGCGVEFVKPFVARIYSDLTKVLIKHFDTVGVPRHWPPIPIYPNRNGVDALLFTVPADCSFRQEFQIYTETDQILGTAKAKWNTVAWSEDGFFLYQLPDFSTFILEQLPLRAELKIEPDGERLRISWTPDYPYNLQESSVLSQYPSWTTISSTNPTSVESTGDQRFYRLVAPVQKVSSNGPPPIPSKAA